MRSKFITFEGGEGAGKSTQIEILAAALRTVGAEVVVTREPGGTPAAEQIRALLVTGDIDRWSSMAEALLNYAARAEHVDKLIRPAIERGAWVLCDRFADSTMAYQGYAGKIDPVRIAAIHNAVLDDLKPGLTLVFDLPVEIGLRRAGGRAEMSDMSEDRFERKGLAFHQRLRDGFLKIASTEPDRCRTINAEQNQEAVASDVAAIVRDVYGIDL